MEKQFPKEQDVYCCGFNGFSQISEFQNISKDVEENSFGPVVENPLKVSKLSPDQALLNVVFTWDKIVASLATTCKSSKYGDDQQVITYSLGSYRQIKVDQVTSSPGQCPLEVHQGMLAAAANDSDVLLTDTSDQSLKLLSHKNDEGPVKCSVQTAKLQSLAGGHTEFYAIYDDIQFGKVCLRDDLSTNKNSEDPTLSVPLHHIDSSVQVSVLSCGKEHVLLLSKHGSVYSYGLGSRGQLGHCTVETETTPRLIEALEGIRMSSISAGGWHSTAVSDSGDLYTWGWNESGQLGLPSLSPCVSTKSSSITDDELVGIQAEPRFTDIPIDTKVTAVACGSRHSVCLTDTHHVLTCGWNTYGQLGQGHLRSLDKFTQIPNLENVVRIFAGHWNSVFVTASKNEAGDPS